MATSKTNQDYVDIGELSTRTGLSRATLWRLKRDGKIPYFQPGGRGARVTFPPNAIELATLNVQPSLCVDGDTQASERLPGPRPKWVSPRQNSNNH